MVTQFKVRDQILIVLAVAFVIHHSLLPKYKTGNFPYKIVSKENFVDKDNQVYASSMLPGILDKENVQVLKHPDHAMLTNSDLVVAVLSAPKNFHQRSEFRKINSAFSLPIVFLIGDVLDPNVQDKLDLEHSRHGDILQFDTVEGYQNLSYKTLSGFTWIANATNNRGLKYI